MLTRPHFHPVLDPLLPGPDLHNSDEPSLFTLGRHTLILKTSTKGRAGGAQFSNFPRLQLGRSPYASSLSRIAAAPMPKPMHMETRPQRAFLSAIS
jgi:hypothetical protein